MYSLRENDYWKEFTQPLLEQNRQTREREEAEHKRIEERKRITRKKAAVKRKETIRKKREAKERQLAKEKLLETPHTCPHCGASKMYKESDILEGTHAKVICKKWRCKKEFIIQDIASLYDGVGNQ
jgi:hypothetical protein